MLKVRQEFVGQVLSYLLTHKLAVQPALVKVDPISDSALHIQAISLPLIFMVRISFVSNSFSLRNLLIDEI